MKGFIFAGRSSTKPYPSTMVASNQLISKKNLTDTQIKIILFSLFMGSVLTRYCIGNFDKSYVIFGDEYLYWNHAKSLASGTELSARNLGKSSNIILYQWLMSLIMRLFSTVRTQIKVITLLNCILTSSIVIWIYKIGKELKLTGKFIVLASILVLTLPDFTMTISFMTENLYFPLAIAIFYFELKLCADIERKELLKYSIFLGVLFACVHLTRDIALCLIVGYVGFEFLQLLFDIVCRKKKPDYVNVCIKMFVPLGCYFVPYKIVSSMIPNSNVAGGISITNRLAEFANIDGVVYFIERVFQDITFTVIAFFVFPVILFVLFWNCITEQERKWMCSLIFSFLITLAVADILVEYMPDTTYQKIRYFFVFLTPMLFMFVKLFQIQRELEYQKISKRIYIFIVCFGIFLVLRYLKLVIYGAVADHSSVEYLRVLGIWIGNVSFSFLNHTFYWADLILKLIWITFLIGGSILAMKYKKIFFIFCCSSMIILNIVNTYFCVQLYEESYTLEASSVNELERLNEYVEQLEGNVLVIIEDSGLNLNISTKLDTYVQKELYFAGEQCLVNLSSESGFVDLKKDAMNIVHVITMESVTYTEPFVVDYIVLADSFVKLDNVQEITTDLRNYKIYKNLDETKIYIKDYSLFPTQNGETHIFSEKDLVFNSKYMNENGKYCSTKNKDYLFLSYRVPAQQGVYKIKLNYNYLGNVTEGEICNLDAWIQVNQEDRFRVFDTRYGNIGIHAGETSKEFELVLDKDVYKAELRLFTFVEGIEFESIEVTKIRDIEQEKKKQAMFPDTIGETCIVEAEDNIFFSAYITENGEYCSTEKQDYLFYGPYISAHKGIYKVKVNYDYTGNLEQGIIGNLDINAVGNYEYNHVEIMAEETSGEFIVIFHEDVTEAEIRLFTFESDIRLKSIEVTRLQDDSGINNESNVSDE